MTLLTIKEVAEILRIREHRAYELVRQEKIPVVRIGIRQLRIDEDVLRSWIRNGGNVNITSGHRADAPARPKDKAAT